MNSNVGTSSGSTVSTSKMATKMERRRDDLTEKTLRGSWARDPVACLLGEKRIARRYGVVLQHMLISHVHCCQLAYSVCGTNSYSELYPPSLCSLILCRPQCRRRLFEVRARLACHRAFALTILQVKAIRSLATGGAWVLSCLNVSTGMERTSVSMCTKGSHS